MGMMKEYDAIKRIRSSKNNISDKKIYLAATSQKAGTEEYRGVYSAGLKLWAAVDCLVNYHNYQVVYEVAKQKSKKES